MQGRGRPVSPASPAFFLLQVSAPLLPRQEALPDHTRSEPPPGSLSPLDSPSQPVLGGSLSRDGSPAPDWEPREHRAGGFDHHWGPSSAQCRARPELGAQGTCWMYRCHPRSPGFLQMALVSIGSLETPGSPSRLGVCTCWSHEWWKRGLPARQEWGALPPASPAPRY